MAKRGQAEPWPAEDHESKRPFQEEALETLGRPFPLTPVVAKVLKERGWSFGLGRLPSARADELGALTVVRPEER